MTLRAEVVAAVSCDLGESPLWIPERNELAWLGITDRTLHRYEASTGSVTSHLLTDTVTAIGLYDEHELVAATAQGFGSVGLTSGETIQRLPVFTSHAGERMNDGAVAPDGSFWAGSCVPEDRPGGASLWRWRGTNEADLMLDNLTISNGLDWPPADPSSMIYVDSAAGSVDRLSLDEHGAVSGRAKIVEIDAACGEPDGLCLDADGRIWVALWGGGEVRAYDPDGTLDEVIAVPARNPSSCAFGGDDGRTLFITSAREGLPDASELDGRLFACRLPVSGLEPRRFAGFDPIG